MCSWGVGMLRGSKNRYLRQNMRLLQEKQAAYAPGSSNCPPRLFTAAELEGATGGYHPDHMIKREVSYELYRGTMGGQAVSVKRPVPSLRGKRGGALGHAVEGLITEIAVLSAVGHRNVVKLMGCCLETQQPALVYELHSRGTLQDHAFTAADGGEPMSWPTLLRVAAEVAAGLHYLHRQAPLAIVHRDLKPSSVVLDNQGVPKIIDFALSVPIPSYGTEAEQAAVAAGTIYYSDPDRLLTACSVTETSDVYSFGMLLVVLMLGRHPGEWEDESGHPFLSVLGCAERESGGTELREGLVATAGGLREAEGMVEYLSAVADLALECLRRNAVERPSMKEVERRLREIMSLMP